LVHAGLARYSSAEDVHLLLALATIPSMAQTLTQNRVIGLLTLLHVQSSTFALDRSKEGLGILSMYAEEHDFDRDSFRVGHHGDQDIVVDVYHQFLWDFFGDQNRSGKYALTDGAYKAVVIKISQFVLRWTFPQQCPLSHDLHFQYIRSY